MVGSFAVVVGRSEVGSEGGLHRAGAEEPRRQNALVRAAVHLGSQLPQFLFRLAQKPITDFGNTLQIALALFRLFINLELLDSLLELAGTCDEVFFFFPFGFERMRFFADIRQFPVDYGQPFFGIWIAFFL